MNEDPRVPRLGNLWPIAAALAFALLVSWVIRSMGG